MQNNYEELFYLYVRYLKVDLANSLINKTKFSKDVDILRIFKEIFFNLYNPNYEQDDIAKQNLKDLKKAIDEFSKEANTIHLDEEKIRNKNVCIEKIKKDEELRKICLEFYFSNQNFSKAFKNSLINKKEFKQFLPQTSELNEQGEYVFVQALLEFSNALSHLAVFIYEGDLEAEKRIHNIKKAKNHLYRATLDNYKIILRFTIPKIKNNKDKLLNSFYSIREQEFLFLGKDISSKVIEYLSLENKQEEAKIIQAYKNLYSQVIENL